MLSLILTFGELPLGFGYLFLLGFRVAWRVVIFLIVLASRTTWPGFRCRFVPEGVHRGSECRFSGYNE